MMNGKEWKAKIEKLFQRVIQVASVPKLMEQTIIMKVSL